ncbi:hypothetical protein P4604_22795 [Lysinibacillus capsici]|uniref:hypothetical protein n=1 Tax=Lysinibacillus capsici TaxID=2115968 RepID=UPI002E1E5B59|nr:hypothetical protein [Lysinibacillus capsici]
MEVLPEGITIRLDIIRSVISILDERIKRAEIALPLCKHTKRKHRLSKLLTAAKQLKQQYITELKEIENAWQCECGSTEYETTYEDNFLTDNQCMGCGKNFSLPKDDDY